LEIQRLIHKIGGSKLSGADSPWLSALHAVDIALYDILGKATGVPLYQFLGGRVRDKIGLSRNLPVRSPEEMAELAVGLKEKGYKLLTVKVGIDPDEDVRRVIAVKKAVGDQFPIEADAGEGYTVDVAISTLKRLEGVLSGIEQPVAWWDYFGMARVCKALDMPVIADQSVPTPRHVSLVLRLEAADQISLKLPEQGGITLASESLAIAKAANIPVSMGSLNPLGVGTAALHHWTTAKEWVRPPIGYGSPLERLGDDIVTEPVQVKNGEVSVSDKPGLGVELDEKKMRQYAVKITVNHH
jgi:L-alanine-DL-glutamate epimerase-like enolase superfamily enzyme